jgi:hypothetical protein
MPFVAANKTHRGRAVIEHGVELSDRGEAAAVDRLSFDH